MWRFLAINDPEVEYVIFRDADSIICYRDAAAVSEWIKVVHYSTLFVTRARIPP